MPSNDSCAYRPFETVIAPLFCGKGPGGFDSRVNLFKRKGYRIVGQPQYILGKPTEVLNEYDRLDNDSVRLYGIVGMERDGDVIVNPKLNRQPPMAGKHKAGSPGNPTKPK